MENSNLPALFGLSPITQLVQKVSAGQTALAGIYGQAYLLQHQFQMAMSQAQLMVPDESTRHRLEAISDQAAVDFNRAVMSLAEEAARLVRDSLQPAEPFEFSPWQALFDEKYTKSAAFKRYAAQQSGLWRFFWDDDGGLL